MEKDRTGSSQRVRIIGGEWRGRRIRFPAGTAVRPTPDRVRETLFNWLANVVPDARCLDLFAGTGVLGFEALSRGAGETWLVERDPMLVRSLEEHVDQLGADARVIRADALSLLQDSPPIRFDLVFLDPPFDMDVVDILLALPPWLASDARVYVERPAGGREDPLAVIEARVTGMRFVKQSRAGRVAYGLLGLEE